MVAALALVAALILWRSLLQAESAGFCCCIEPDSYKKHPAVSLGCFLFVRLLAFPLAADFVDLVGHAPEFAVAAPFARTDQRAQAVDAVSSWRYGVSCSRGSPFSPGPRLAIGIGCASERIRS
ncbi:MAG: hypothetical protein R2912_08810 [Eubacteriales bacterium]